MAVVAGGVGTALGHVDRHAIGGSEGDGSVPGVSAGWFPATHSDWR